MKRVWYIFKEYYFIGYAITIFIFGIPFFMDNSSEELVAEQVIFVSVLFFMTIVGTFDFFKQEFYRANKIKKILRENPFNSLKKLRFQLKNNEYVGSLSGYIINIGAEWESYQKKPNFYLKVLFDPRIKTSYMEFDEFLKYNELSRDEFYVGLNYILKDYNRKQISKMLVRDFVRDINTLVDFLKTNKVNSIGHCEWSKSRLYLEEIESYYLSKT